MTGDVSVLDAFFDANRSLALAVCSGGVRHAYTGGAMAYLKRKRLRERFAAFAGVSGGIGTIVNFAGGGKAPSIRIFSDDMSDRRLFSRRRRFFGKYPFNVDHLDDVFTYGVTGRAFDYDAAVSQPAPIFAVLGCPETGESIIHRLRTPEDARMASVYGAAVTGLSRPCYFHGRPVTDGFFTKDILPVRFLHEQTGVTDVLVFAGGARLEQQSKWSRRIEAFAYWSGFARANATVRKLIASREERFTAEVEAVTTKNTPRVLVIWMPVEVPVLRIPRPQSRELIRMGWQTMKELLKGRGP